MIYLYLIGLQMPCVVLWLITALLMNNLCWPNMMKTKQTRTQVPANVDRVIVNGEVKQVMTKSLEQEIVENSSVAKGWTHHVIDNGTNYTFMITKLGTAIWVGKWDCYTNCKDSLPDLDGIRSRKDIEQIIALQNENAEKDKRIKKLKAKCDEYLLAHQMGMGLR